MDINYDNLLHRLDITLRNDWGVTVNERQRMRALLWEARDAIRELKEQQSFFEIPIRSNAGNED
jgi:hypothetical protein